MGKNFRRRYYDALNAVPTGWRVAGFVPLSFIFWGLVVLLFNFVWTHLPPKPQSVPFWPNFLFLPVGVWIAWLVIWPSEPAPTCREQLDELTRTHVKELDVIRSKEPAVQSEATTGPAHLGPPKQL